MNFKRFFIHPKWKKLCQCKAFILTNNSLEILFKYIIYLNKDNFSKYEKYHNFKRLFLIKDWRVRYQNNKKISYY